MTARLTTKRPCNLAPGDIRPTPVDGRHAPLGWHMVCPACARVVVVEAAPGQALHASVTGLSFVLSWVCPRCARKVSLTDGTFRLEP